MTFKLHDPERLVASLVELPRETGWLEFKENKFEAKSTGKYVSGLANSAMLESKDTAFMVWGVRDGDHAIVGTSVRLENERIGSEPFIVWLNKQLNPRITITHEAIEVDGKHLQLLCINPGYIQPVAFQGDEFVRVDSSLQPLKNYPERTRALWQITSSYAFEKSSILPHATIDDIYSLFSVDSLLKLLKAEDRSRRNAMEILEHHGMVRDNMQGGFEVFALLAITCAKRLDEFPITFGKSMRITHYKGSSKLDTLQDTFGERGYTTSFTGMLDHILARVPSSEVLKGGIRSTVYQIPELAIRELLANSLVHQDLTIRGARPTVEIYSDRIKFINPGVSLIPPERFIDTPSVSRNEKLAELMRLAGLCELRGSGVDRAVREIERAFLPPPLFANVEGATVVTVYMPKKFSEMTPAERVRACFQHAQLMHEDNKAISNSTLRARFGLPTTQISQVSNVLREAVEAGRIRPVDPNQGNRNARYVPAYV